MENSDISDPLTSQASEEPNLPEPQEPEAENQTTSKVFNLDPNEPPEEPKTTFCCQLDKTLTELPKIVLLPKVNITMSDLREQVKPAITIEDVIIILIIGI